MPVFYNSGANSWAVVSFKVLYSRFSAASSWHEISVEPTLRILLRAMVTGGLARTWFPVRSPYERTVSCFMDKFRKQPRRIDAMGFEWQHCHEILYPHLEIQPEASDSAIADRFLAFTFDQFLELLPEVYARDGHFKPQAWSRNVRLGEASFLCWPRVRPVRVEDSAALNTIPGIDFSKKTNTTGHLERDFVLNEVNRTAIRTLYGCDFALGGHPV